MSWLLLLLFGAAWGSGDATEEILPGLLYKSMVLEGPVSMHLLEIDPRQADVFAARALSNGIGKEKVSSMARRNGAVAGVNGGYFSNTDLYEGDPAGNLRIDGEWYSVADSRFPALGWTRDGTQTRLGMLAARWRVILGNNLYQVSGFNRPRGSRETVLYSWAFHRSTLTDPGGVEVAVSEGKVVGIAHSGDAKIPHDGFVLSFGPSVASAAKDIKAGMEARVTLQADPDPQDRISAEEWLRMDYIVGGAPLLLRNGDVVGPPENSTKRKTFYEQRHPRTAVGVRQDGTWLVVVVDGRQPTVSQGMTLEELALKLKSWGCRYAMNLDGGGSTTLYLKGAIVNSPSDFGMERAVSDAILIRKRESTPGGNSER